MSMTQQRRAPREEWANGLRGLAAVTVVLFHYCVAFWVHQEAAANLVGQPPLWKSVENAPRFAQFINSLPIEFGGFGVSLFFLLSGYVIAFSLDRYSRLGFLVGRIFRIVPTYAIGYLIGCLTLWHFAHNTLPLTAPGLLTGMIPGLTRWTMVPAPDDGVVWTLIVEAVFYAMCLVLHRWLTKNWIVILAMLAACFACQYYFWNLGHTKLPFGLQYFMLLACPFIPLMLVGVAFHSHQHKRLSNLQAILLVGMLVAGQFTLIVTSAMLKLTLVYAFSCVLAVVVFGFAYVYGRGWKQTALTEFFADISYPLYVVHPLVGYMVISKLTMLGLPVIYNIVAALALSLSLAYILHLSVERWSQVVGRNLARRLSP